ncbi:DUF4115 domain-containing protein [Alicyclobacillus tolerans]|uniref:helix-turn-helix domain-containing protein n=1 Tax=Alicyclobacillus tolerans TaxID=90970 RepID=UPI001F3DCD40|nr:RodZ domain-containing protein [Alicyclobacillus tolerans]MCF8564823.1 DUF4115 domain-containing protein [Alicyclobacillus tolerans]
MHELGRQLREKRLQLGIDLDTVQEKTKIRKRYLKALEEGNWDVIPGEVYARGFVRSYAEFLGLDGQELLRLFAPIQDVKTGESANDETPAAQDAPVPSLGKGPTRENAGFPDASKPLLRPEKSAAAPVDTRDFTDTQDARDARVKPVPQSAPVRRERRPRVQGGRSLNGLGQIGVVAGVLVILAAGWYMLSHSGGQQSSANSPGQNNFAAVGGSNTTTPAAPKGTTNVPANAATNGVNANVTNQTAGGAQSNNATTNSLSTQNPPTQISAQPFNGRSQNYSVTTTGPMTVQLAATNAQCWVSVTADGAVVDGSDMINPGQSKSWQATKSMTINVGRVESVQISVNGQPVVLPNVNGAIYVTFTKSP